jgi:hemoglobin
VVAASPPAVRCGELTEDGIRQLLARFYGRVRRDAQLGPVFARVVGTTEAEWAPHLARLADFWSSVMLRSGRYHGDPFSTHLRLPDLEPAMFDRWLALFGESCAELFESELAAALRGRAERIARSLRMGLFERLPAAPARVAAAPPASS